jgi:hypothetical protein
MATRLEIAVDHKPARARLVHEHQLPVQRLELAHRPRQRVHVSADPTVMPNLATFLGNGDVDRFLVHIHPDKQLARLAIHGLPPVSG